ncbi:MAG TPA: GTPase HflX, partial [Nitrospiria bacterium]|nr:GTPase HflX [Nitrospiria bacterium]
MIVGDQNEILIPDLSEWRLGKKRLRGVRCIHTHLKNSPLDQGDITDLSILRLDLMAALGIGGDGLPGNIYMAHLLPPNTDAKVYEVHTGIPFFKLDLDLEGFLSSIEDEIARAEKATLDVRDRRERALLVSVSTGSRSEQSDSIEELKELARSANLHVIGSIFQRPKKIDPRYLMGSGKIKELIIKALQEGAELVVFDRDLSPAQLMAISTITDMKVIDRTQLILDIFAQRANSMDGKIQVELAQLKYRLPRLSERSTALSRLTGGIGGRGPGETRLEIDMRRARDKIAHLEKQLDALSRSRSERARRRNESGIPIISIVGYTNAGKSTLLNVLTESSVSTKDLLFATLDTSTRR